MNTKTMTTLIILCTLVIGVVIGALGSGMWRQKRESKFERMMPRQRFLGAMERIIDPTDTQREAIDKILKKRSEQITAVNEEHQNQIFTIYDSLQSELSSVLTKEQLNRLEDRLAKGAKQYSNARIGRLAEMLQLDENQQNRIEEIMTKFEEQMPSNRRDFEGNRKQRREDMQKRFDNLQEEIEAVLTPEQIEQYREMRIQMRPPFGPPFDKPGRGRRFRKP